MTTISLHIDEVVLHGFDAVDRPALERALTVELERHLAGLDLGASRRLGLARGAPLRSVEAADSPALGRELARSLMALLDAAEGGGTAARR
ncbi:MAG: hypothetical protein M0R73_02385 [Dehalococcoidia bacterium]|nr:hypothetical protein [Dehalococcoidia bacterium]